MRDAAACGGSAESALLKHLFAYLVEQPNPAHEMPDRLRITENPRLGPGEIHVRPAAGQWSQSAVGALGRRAATALERWEPALRIMRLGIAAPLSPRQRILAAKPAPCWSVAGRAIAPWPMAGAVDGGQADDEHRQRCPEGR